MSLLGKVFGSIVPSIMFHGQPAAVESINFLDNEALVVLRLPDGNRVEVHVKHAGLRLL